LVVRGEAHRFLTIPGIGSEVWALTAIAPWARPSYTITYSVTAWPTKPVRLVVFSAYAVEM